MEEHLPKVHKTLGSIPSVTKNIPCMQLIVLTYTCVQ